LVAIRCFCLLPKKETKTDRKKESDDSTSAIAAAAAAAAAGIDLDWFGLELVFVFCCNTYNIISC
jgi:hypothetical protein